MRLQARHLHEEIWKQLVLTCEAADETLFSRSMISNMTLLMADSSSSAPNATAPDR